MWTSPGAAACRLASRAFLARCRCDACLLRRAIDLVNRIMRFGTDNDGVAQCTGSGAGHFCYLSILSVIRLAAHVTS